MNLAARIMQARRPIILGIVNITEDSFSDGGKYLEPASAIAHARRLVEDGADVVDLGPASSHPDAAPVPASDEIRRIGPVLDALLSQGIPVSVDTYQPATQAYCVARGVQYLNDIQGFADPESHATIAEGTCKLIVMHSVQGRGRATRVASDAGTILDRASRFFDERIGTLEAAGVARDRLIVDPGMGFFLGSSPEPSIALLKNIGRLKERFGQPVLVSVSRKSFLGAITRRDTFARGAATLAAELYAASQHVDYIRTHDAAALNDALTVFASLAG